MIDAVVDSMSASKNYLDLIEKLDRFRRRKEKQLSLPFDYVTRLCDRAG
jgi:hypothetical protein